MTRRLNNSNSTVQVCYGPDNTQCKAVVDPGCYQVPTHSPVEVSMMAQDQCEVVILDNFAALVVVNNHEYVKLVVKASNNEHAFTIVRICEMWIERGYMRHDVTQLSNNAAIVIDGHQPRGKGQS